MCPRAIIFIRIIVESWSSRKFPDWSKPREWNHLTPNFRGSLLFEISSGFPTRDRRSLIVAVHRAINFPKVSLNDGKSRWNLAQKKNCSPLTRSPLRVVSPTLTFFASRKLLDTTRHRRNILHLILPRSLADN